MELCLITCRRHCLNAFNALHLHLDVYLHLLKEMQCQKVPEQNYPFIPVLWKILGPVSSLPLCSWHLCI